MFVKHHISLKDIYMSYKVYVTYICCVILNNIQIHFNPSRTYVHIHQSIVFGHLLLRMHYSMAPPGLDPEKGSQRFISFLVGLLVFGSEGRQRVVQKDESSSLHVEKTVPRGRESHLSRSSFDIQ
jgi:hypothetical protein